MDNRLLQQILAEEVIKLKLIQNHLYTDTSTLKPSELKSLVELVQSSKQEAQKPIPNPQLVEEIDALLANINKHRIITSYNLPQLRKMTGMTKEESESLLKGQFQANAEDLASAITKFDFSEKQIAQRIAEDFLKKGPTGHVSISRILTLNERFNKLRCSANVMSKFFEDPVFAKFDQLMQMLKTKEVPIPNVIEIQKK